MINEKKLIEEIESLTMHITGLRAGKGVLSEFAKHYKESVLRIIDEQPKTDWIPCEIETPKTNGVYQTVRKVIEGDAIYYLEGASYFDGQNTWHNDIGVNHGREYPNVIAWQPIQLYKKEGAEQWALKK